VLVRRAPRALPDPPVSAVPRAIAATLAPWAPRVPKEGGESGGPGEMWVPQGRLEE
jgi:hypothetical protein